MYVYISHFKYPYMLYICYATISCYIFYILIYADKIFWFWNFMRGSFGLGQINPCPARMQSSNHWLKTSLAPWWPCPSWDPVGLWEGLEEYGDRDPLLRVIRSLDDLGWTLVHIAGSNSDLRWLSPLDAPLWRWSRYELLGGWMDRWADWWMDGWMMVGWRQTVR